MKICRFSLINASLTPRVGVVIGDTIRDVTAAIDGLLPQRWPAPIEDQLIANLASLRPTLEELAAIRPSIALESVTLLSPIATPPKVLCGSGKWKRHGAPFGMIGFMGKAATAISGAGEGLQIRWPDRTTLHEPGLAIIIGRLIDHPVSEAEALSYVAGYACAFDTTLQPEREDWAVCKSFDSYGTLGPWLVTADEIPDPSNLSYKFWIDGELRGERNFSGLTGAPAQMIAFASTAMTLYPGDIVLSGGADAGSVLPGKTMAMEIPEIGRMSVQISISPYARSKSRNGEKTNG